jgi:hypothetical protein
MVEQSHKPLSVRHPSFFGDVPGAHYFAPMPDSCQGPFVVISPINGQVELLERLWNLLTMESWFGNATIIFTGNYLAGPHAKRLMSLLSTLRMSQPSPIFLAGPQDLAAAAYLGLLKNLELQVALLAVGTSWAESHSDVFASYGVDSVCATDLVHAMPPEHREFMTELATSVKHPEMTLTGMPRTELTADAPISSFASDLLAIPHPISDADALPPSSASGSTAAGADGSSSEEIGVSMDGLTTSTKLNTPMASPREVVKTLYVDPLAQYPSLKSDGVAVNGEGRLSALFYPSGHVVTP